jgi:hypothetical protein
MSKIIKFIAQSKKHYSMFDVPIPAFSVIPEWYKQQDVYADGSRTVSDKGIVSHTIKRCMPVADMMTSGYLILAPCDIDVSLTEDNLPMFKWGGEDFTAIDSHPNSQYNKMPIDSSYLPFVYKFINPWIIQTPQGYSTLFIHPTYRDDLPFYCLPAVVDTDKHPQAVNFPFFIKKDFTGVIPMGTPLMQVIPFKREDWESETDWDKDSSLFYKGIKTSMKLANRYKTFSRTRKSYK